ncbi:G5 domain-containing protein [Candidatus Saccharibacteria bacterium]|nr:MAG: G5 domain-containing protein [Candidatus Saccharibacteria bacterium]
MQQNISWRRPLFWAVIIGSLLLISLLGLLGMRNRVMAAGEGERVVTIFDGEREQTLVTSAKTVKEALDRANVSLSTFDAVEPAADTELVAQNYNVNVYRARPVVVIDGTQKKHIVSPHKSARQVAEKAGIALYPEDTVQVDRVDDILADGAVAQKVEIDRATAFTLVLYGKRTDARTQATTVAELLKEKNIQLGPKDQVSLPHETALTVGMTVEVWRDGKQTITEEQEVAFPTKQIQNKDKEIGFKEVQTPGKAGKKVVTYEIEMKNGKEIARKEIQSVVTEQPAEQVEIVGAKPKTPTGTANPTGNKAIGKQLMMQAGFGEDQWGCLESLWNKESGWNEYAGNKSSGAYGIPQALPGSKMASVGADWQTNPATQIQWGLGYIKGRYGSPCGAWNAFLSKGWY